MPSPFPGMDPYLEDPEFFPGLHDRLISRISDVLRTELPSPYYAEIRSRVWIEHRESSGEPDVNVLRSAQPGKPEPRAGTATVAARSHSVPVEMEEMRELCVEIYTVRGKQQLETAVEVLSPSNKKPGEDARDLYVRKQRDMIRNRVNLVEIDLLRGGTHATAVPRETAIRRAGAFDYHVGLYRMDEPDRRSVYPIRLEEPLPRIAVPLLPGDADVILDLQAVFTHCYDLGPYHVRSPYLEHQPEPPLTPEQAAWATQLLRDKGLLPPT